MRLISKSVLREIWPPFLLGFAAYTFILLIRTILILADFAVRRSAPFSEVVRLVLLSLPWIIVLTLPMAFLLGVLVGLGRMGADAELTALEACGVGLGAIYRPALGAAAAASAGVLLLYNLVLPPANAALQREMTRVAATSIVNLAAPRTFREPKPGITFYFDRLAPDGRSFEGIFLKLGDETEAPNRVIVAQRGGLTLEGEQLWLDLSQSTVHEVDPDDVSRYRASKNATQRLLLAGEARVPGSSVRVERGPRSSTLSELWEAAHRPGVPARNRRPAWVEIHKKFAIPFACLAFAWIGIPLARRLRGGRGGSFAASLAILVGYYVLLTSGETWATEGRLSPAVAVWLPNAALLAIGAAAAIWRPKGRAPRAPRPPLDETAPLARAPAKKSGTTIFGTEPRLGLLSLVDKYVLGRFAVALVFVFASAILLSVVVDYADKLDEVARNHPSLGAVFGFYRYFVLSIAIQIAPFAVLMSALVGLGLLSRHNEDTAFRAAGVSLPRLAAPVIVAAALAAAAVFAVGEYVLPFAEQQEARYRNVIRGRPPEFEIHTAAERNWYLAGDGRLWFREETDARRGALEGVAVFELGEDGQLRRRLSGREAVWDGQEWSLREGWERRFDGSDTAPYRTFVEERIPGDPPRAVAASRRRPEEMRFRELDRLTRRLRASGYATSGLETALQAKLAQPAMLPIMALLATPFAFTIGRRGTLAGVGVGLALGILALVTAAFATKLGEVGALPPVLAAWSPVVLFGLAASYLLLRMRT